MWPSARLLTCALVGLLVMPPAGAALAGPDAPPAESVAVPTGAAQAAHRSLTLYMKAGAFDPATDGVPLPAALAAATSEGSDGRVRFVLQFEAGVDGDLVARLRARGIEFERYLPEGGMIASAQPRAVPASAGAVGARALLPLAPGFKLDPALWGEALEGGPGRARVSVLMFETRAPLGALLPHGALLAFDGRLAIVDAPRRELLPLAREGDVEWVEPYFAPAPQLNYTTRIVSARQGADGTFLGDGRSLWAYNNATDIFSGNDGRGITVSIADSGIDLSHPGFAGRVVAYYDYDGDGSRCDCEGGFPHGTHVAGIVAGDGSWRTQDENRTDGFFAGVAPGALLVAQEIFETARTPSQYSQDAYEAGAFVSSNSWASSGGGVYTSFSQEYDEAVRDANGREAGAPQMVYVFSAGNAGPYPESTGAPSTGKNVISVGATGNTRSSSAGSVASFSSRGPASDGRIKPDVVAPGADVVSARGDLNGTGCWGEGACSYLSASGTSMSAPAVSGVAALVAAGYRERTGALPSAAMLKAMLIASATPLPGYAYAGPDQGWGRVDASRTLNENASYRHVLFEEGPALSTASAPSSVNMSVFVEPGHELRVALVWSDVPGTTSSSKALINDLDLEATGPDGRRYAGNQFLDGYSRANLTRDTLNTVEVLRFRSPERGVWNFSVRASVVPSGDQRFALVVAGNVTDKWVAVVPGEVVVSPASPKEDDPLLVSVPVHNTGTVYSGPLRVVLRLEGPEGNETQEVEVLQVRPGDDIPAFFWFAPKRGSYTLRIAVDPGGTSGDLLPQDNNRTAAFFVRGFEVALTAVKNASALGPLATDTLLLQVTNRGNVDDTLSINATGSTGWSVALNTTARRLGPGESTFIAGSVTAPDRALAGELGTFTVHATSGGNISRAAELNFTVPVAALPSSRLAQLDSSAAVDPGASATFRYTVENTGNTPLDLVFTPAFTPQDPPSGWEFSPGAQSLELAPYTRVDRSVTVVAPREALAGEMRTLRLTVESAQEGASSELLFRVVANRTVGFSMTVPDTEALGELGGQADFVVRIDNVGNGRETFSLAVATLPGGPPGLVFEVVNGSLVVPAFGHAYAAVTAKVSMEAGAGTGSARLAVVAQSGANAFANFTVVVPAAHSLRVDAPARVTLQQGSSAVALVTVQNEGNVNEPIVVSLAALPAGVSLSGWGGPSTVARGDSRSFTVVVSASPSAAVGRADVTLVIEPAPGGGAERVEAVLHLDVKAAPANEPAFAPGLGGAAAAAVLVGVALVARGRPLFRRKPR